MTNIIRITENKLHKIVKESVRNILKEALTHSYTTRLSYSGKENSIHDKLGNLGFIRCHTQRDYDGNFSFDRVTYRIPKEKYTSEVEKELQTLLNFYGFFLSSKKTGSDIYNGEPCIYITIEATYGRQEPTLNIYYHATPNNKVNKILKQGLTPKNNDPMRPGAPTRIYLCKRPNETLFQSIRSDQDYTIFKVDLTNVKDKIKVYTDVMTDDDSVYTYDYIPPQCLSIIEKPSDKRSKYIDKIRQTIDSEICDKIPGLKTEGEKLIGTITNNNTSIEVNVTFGSLYRVYGYWNDEFNPRHTLGLEGYKVKTTPDGKRRKYLIGKNFDEGNIPVSIMKTRDRYLVADYKMKQMVKYLYKWILS